MSIELLKQSIQIRIENNKGEYSQKTLNTILNQLNSRNTEKNDDDKIDLPEKNLLETLKALTDSLEKMNANDGKKINISQTNILSALRTYLNFKKNNPHLNTFVNPQGKTITIPIDQAQIRRLISVLNKGYCAGIGALWAYGKWLSIQSSQRKGKSNDVFWYYSTALTLVNTPPDQLTSKDKADIEELLSAIESMQYSLFYFKVGQARLDITVGMTAQAGHTQNKLQHEFNIAGLWTKNQFIKLFEKINPAYDKLICINSHNHTTFVSITDDSFTYFDPNRIEGEETFTSLEELTEAIFHSNELDEKKPSPLAINIFGFDEKASYPDPLAILNEIKPVNKSELGYANNFNGLIIAAAYGAVAAVEYYINQKEISTELNHTNKRNQTALILAALYGHLDIVKKLIVAGAKLDHADKKDQTALSYATQYGRLEIVRMLLEAGANINQKNKEGWTVLMLAAEYGNIETVKLLLEYQANSNLKNAKDETALDIAQRYGHDAIVELLEQQDEEETEIHKNYYQESEPLLFFNSVHEQPVTTSEEVKRCKLGCITM